MKKTNILFLIITTFVAFGICMYLTSCKCEFKPVETPQSSKIIHVHGCGIYYVDVTHDNHEYLISNYGGIIHKVNCKFCKNKRNEQ
jgi:hypothetical protein